MEIKKLACELESWAQEKGWKTVTQLITPHHFGDLLQPLDNVTDSDEYARRLHNNKQITRGSGTNTLTYSIYYNGASYGTGDKRWSFNYDGSATSQGAWVNGSDERHKSNIKPVSTPLAAVLSMRGVTYDVQDGGRGVGLIAQDVENWCPDAVKTYGDREFSDGTVIENFKFLDTSGVSAAYHTEAIKELFTLVELVLIDPEKARDVINVVKEATKPSQSGL